MPGSQRGLRLLRATVGGALTSSDLDTQLADGVSAGAWRDSMQWRTSARTMVASEQGMGAVAASREAMRGVASSRTALDEISRTSRAVSQIAGSTTAIEEVMRSTVGLPHLDRLGALRQAVVTSATGHQIARTESGPRDTVIRHKKLFETARGTTLERSYDVVMAGHNAVLMSVTPDFQINWKRENVDLHFDEHGGYLYVGQERSNMMLNEDRLGLRKVDRSTHEEVWTALRGESIRLVAVSPDGSTIIAMGPQVAHVASPDGQIASEDVSGVFASSTVQRMGGFDGNGNFYVADHAEKLYRRATDGTWSELATMDTNGNTVFCFDVADDGHVIAGFQSNTVKLHDSDGNFQWSSNVSDAPLACLALNGGDFIGTDLNNGIYRFARAGGSQVTSKTLAEINQGGSFRSGYGLTKLSDSEIYVTTDAEEVLQLDSNLDAVEEYDDTQHSNPEQLTVTSDGTTILVGEDGNDHSGAMITGLAADLSKITEGFYRFDRYAVMRASMAGFVVCAGGINNTAGVEVYNMSDGRMLWAVYGFGSTTLQDIAVHPDGSVALAGRFDPDGGQVVHEIEPSNLSVNTVGFPSAQSLDYKRDKDLLVGLSTGEVVRLDKDRRKADSVTLSDGSPYRVRVSWDNTVWVSNDTTGGQELETFDEQLADIGGAGLSDVNAAISVTFANGAFAADGSAVEYYPDSATVGRANAINTGSTENDLSCGADDNCFTVAWDGSNSRTLVYRLDINGSLVQEWDISTMSGSFNNQTINFDTIAASPGPAGSGHF